MRCHNFRTHFTVSIAVAVFAFVALPAGAMAANTQVSSNGLLGTTLTITDDNSASNLTVTQNGPTVSVIAASSTVTGGFPCSQVSPRQVRCTALGFDQVDATLNDGNDMLTLDTSSAKSNVSAGAGTDTITGADGGADSISGGADADTISGRRGADSLSGDDGDDTIHGDAGNDSIHGGDGADQLFGDDGADQLFGDDGTDTLTGGDGADVFVGGAFNDTLNAVDETTDTSFDCGSGAADVLNRDLSPPDPPRPANCELGIDVP